MATILVIDPSPAVRETLRIVLGAEHAVAAAASWDEVATQGPAPDLLVYGAPLFPRHDARAARARIARTAPLLLLNAEHEVDAAAIAGRDARIAFLPKPFELHALRTRVRMLLSPAPSPRPAPGAPEHPRRWLEHPFIALPAAALAHRASLSDLPVLLVGEAGTGAIEVASAIHCESGGRPPIPVHGAHGLDFAALASPTDRPTAAVIENVHELARATQYALLDLLRDGGADRVRIFATTDADLERYVAANAVVPELAYALAPLTITLTPLRDRLADVPALAQQLTPALVSRLGLEAVTYTDAALARLQRYLWFGNVAELEAVLARTLAVHRPRVVEPDALLFTSIDASRALAAPMPAEATTATLRARGAPPEGTERRWAGDPECVAAQSGKERAVMRKDVSHAIGEPAAIVEPHATVEPDATVESATPGPHATVSAPPPSPTSGDDPKLEVLLGELAHELRNPMVTVKTFAQHLDSVLADPESRARFAALTGEAITRMDTLLETLLDFSRFRAPERRPVDLSALLVRALAERSDELARRNVHVDAPQNGSGAVVVEADESQVSFALRSLVDGLVGDLVAHSPVRVRATADGTLELAVHADRAIAARLAAYVAGADDAAGGAHPPLAFALATALIRRNRGTLDVRSAADGAMIISVSLPRPARQDSER